MTKTIGIISIKGGVGKTTVSSSIASELANSFGKKVMLVDANYSAPNAGLHMDIVNPSKTIHHVLGRKENMKSAVCKKFGVDVVPGSYVYQEKFNPLKLKDKLARIKHNYDFVVIDSSPSLDEEVLSTILASDILFVVTTPDYPTLSCSLRAARLAKQRGKPIKGVILNKLRDKKYEINMRDLEESLGIPVVAKLRDDYAPARALFHRMPVTYYSRSSGFTKEIHRFCGVLSGKGEKISFFRKLLPKGFRREEVNREVLRDNLFKP